VVYYGYEKSYSSSNNSINTSNHLRGSEIDEPTRLVVVVDYFSPMDSFGSCGLRCGACCGSIPNQSQGHEEVHSPMGCGAIL